jgi:hypothetical protein
MQDDAYFGKTVCVQSNRRGRLVGGRVPWSPNDATIWKWMIGVCICMYYVRGLWWREAADEFNLRKVSRQNKRANST